MSIFSSFLGGTAAPSPAAANPASLATAATDIGVSALPALFSKSGVPPDFFAKFPFLKFFDNSTGHWKSRFALMRNWTPNQRIAWYIDRIVRDGTDFHDDVVQYSEMYGTLHDNIDDTEQIDYALAKAFNDAVDLKYFHGKNIVVQGYSRDRIVCDLSKAKNKPLLGSFLLGDQSGNSAKRAGMNPLFLLLLIPFGYALIKKRRNVVR